MDPVTLAFYAVVCALLSLGSSRFRTPLTRLAIGAVVGIVAAALLPVIRNALAI